MFGVGPLAASACALPAQSPVVADSLSGPPPAVRSAAFQTFDLHRPAVRFHLTSGAVIAGTAVPGAAAGREVRLRRFTVDGDGTAPPPDTVVVWRDVVRVEVPRLDRRRWRRRVLTAMVPVAAVGAGSGALIGRDLTAAATGAGLAALFAWPFVSNGAAVATPPRWELLWQAP